MKKVLEWFNKGLNAIFHFLQFYSKVVLVAVVVIVSAQVISRKFLHYSIIWSEEVALLLMVWTAFISLAIGVAKKLHISIELFYNKCPKPIRTFSDWLSYLVTAFVGLALMINGARLVMATLHSTLPTTKWPSFFLYLMIPVGGFFTVYCTVLHMFFPSAARVFADEFADPAPELPPKEEEKQ